MHLAISGTSAMDDRAVRAVIADDHEIVRRGVKLVLKAMPEVEVVYEAADGRQAMEALGRLQPELVILDLTMPEFSGVEVLGEIQRRSPQTRTLIFTGSESNARALRALDMGASGVVLKSSPPDMLIEAVRCISEGNTFVDAALAGEQASTRATKPLTRREMQVLEGLLQGQSNTTIAERFHISPATVNNHRSNIMRKLNVHSVAELVSTVLQDEIGALELS